MKSMIQVVCAIIQNQDKILIAQRSEKMSLPLKWEFPGGKMEAGEDEKEALKREIKEELNLEISVEERLTPVEYHYPDFSIRLIPWLCRTEQKNVKKTEHKEVRWVNLKELNTFDWVATDVAVVGELIKHTYKNE